MRGRKKSIETLKKGTKKVKVKHNIPKNLRNDLLIYYKFDTLPGKK
jgi:ribosomal protein L30E